MDIKAIRDITNFPASDIDWIVVPALVVAVDVEGIKHQGTTSAHQEEWQDDVDLGHTNERCYHS